MLKSIFKFSLGAALFASLSACGIGVENDESATAQQRQYDKVLNERFAPVRGTYEGTISSPSGAYAPQRARLLLYVVTATGGSNPDGTVQERPTLYGRFQLVDVVAPTDYLSMSGNYDSIGRLQISSVSTTPVGVPSSGNTLTISALGQVDANHASVDISNTGGFWGHFEGDHTSGDAPAPGSGDNQELSLRLQKLYQTVAGIYQATVDSGVERTKVRIAITIGETGQGGAGASIPVLMGQYQRMDFPTGIGVRALAINYDALSGAISMTGVQGGGTVPGSSIFSARGKFINGVLDVNMSDSRGPAGQFKAKRLGN